MLSVSLNKTFPSFLPISVFWVAFCACFVCVCGFFLFVCVYYYYFNKKKISKELYNLHSIIVYHMLFLKMECESLYKTPVSLKWTVKLISTDYIVSVTPGRCDHLSD